MGRSKFVKTWLIPTICVASFVLWLLPIGVFGIGILIRAAAICGCLFTLCAGRLNTKNILISIAVVLVGVQLFGLLLGYIMSEGIVMLEILDFASNFVALWLLYCVICKKNFEDISYVAIIIAVAMAGVSGILSAIPYILVDLNGIAGDMYDAMELALLENKLSPFQGLAFCIALGVGTSVQMKKQTQ